MKIFFDFSGLRILTSQALLARILLFYYISLMRKNWTKNVRFTAFRKTYSSLKQSLKSDWMTGPLSLLVWSNATISLIELANNVVNVGITILTRKSTNKLGVMKKSFYCFKCIGSLAIVGSKYHWSWKAGNLLKMQNWQQYKKSFLLDPS